MIEFLGTSLLPRIGSHDTDANKLNMAVLCGVGVERGKQLTDAITEGKAQAFVPHEIALMPGMEPVAGQAFSIVQFIAQTQLDTDTPSEVFFVGMLIGRVYAEMDIKSEKTQGRLIRMVELMQQDPAKALRKMMKDIKKAGNAKKADNASSK